MAKVSPRKTPCLTVFSLLVMIKEILKFLRLDLKSHTTTDAVSSVYKCVSMGKTTS